MEKRTISIVIVVVLAVLLVFSLLQAVKLKNLKKEANELNTEKTTTGFIAKSGNNNGATLPSNIQNLPSMVGGC